MQRLPVAALVGLALLGAACGPVRAGSDGGPTDPTTDAPTLVPTEAPTDIPLVTPIALDWTDRPAMLDLGDGWTVGACVGDAPLFCVEEDGVAVGVLELTVYPQDRDLFPTATLTDEELAARAQEIYDSFRPDREALCGGDHAFVTTRLSPVTVGGQPGVRYGFGVEDPEGTSVESVVGYLTVRDHSLVILAANAMLDGGCFADDEFVGFDPETLDRFAPYLDRLAAGSVLPAV